jgi:hypothetical protein
MAVRDDRSAVARDGRVGRQAGAEDLELVIGGTELAVQLGELAGVLGVGPELPKLTRSAK